MAELVQMAVLNESDLITDAEIEPMVAAVQEFISASVGTPWGVAVSLTQIPKGDPAPAGMWQMAFLNDTDQANALGYHERTWQGLYLGKVFVRTTQNLGQSVSRVLSHEVMEALVDPNLNRTVPGGPVPYAIEVGDPLSRDSQGRDVLGQRMSGIALPAYYYPNYGTNYDLDGHLSGPIPTPAKEGGTYLMWFDGLHWQSHMYALEPEDFLAMQASSGSRRHRRMLGANSWRNSTAGARTS
jgi:hypothetical protein